MVSRLIACFVCAVATSACDGVREAKAIGTWRCETEDGIEEFSLHRDHSFWSLYSSKKEFTTPSPIEETGSWRLAGNRLLFDSITTWSKQKSQISHTLVRLTRDALVLKSFNGSQDLSYQRMEDVVCAPSPSESLSEAALAGSWKTHYNTHDYQYRFEPGGRLQVLGLISGEWRSLWGGEWHINGGKLLLQLEDTAYGALDREEETWTPISIGSNCLAMKGASSRPCIMRRLQ